MVFDPAASVTEERRLTALRELELLNTPHEAEFDALVAIALRLFDCPIATITLVDDHRQWFKARAGLAGDGCPRRDSICAVAMYEPDLLVVEDLTADPRFAANPIVAGDPRVRFYAGVPLRPTDTALPGVGTLCVMDTRPRAFGEEAAALLRQLGTTVCSVIRARASAAATLRLSAEVKRHADTIHLQNAQLRQAERMVGVGSWRLDLRDDTILWSDHVFAIYGLPVGEVPDYEGAMGAYPPDARAELQSLIERARDRGEPFEFESDFTAANGRRRRVRCMGEPQLVDGEVSAIVGVFQDVTERFDREQQLKETASTDVLTGLPNRRDFEQVLVGAIQHSRRTGEPLALLLLDLDGFKAVNDTLGHDAGDEVLRRVADRLGAAPLGRAYAARLGGDEFVLLVTRPRDCANLEAFVETALSRLRVTVERPAGRRSVSATIGAARFEGGAQGPGDLLRRADLALYGAKQRKRGTGRIDGPAAGAIIQAAL